MKKYLLILFVIAKLVSACAPRETATSLTGTTWKLTAFGRVDSPSPAVPDSKGVITFGADGKLTGIGACNEFNGNYEVKDNQIILSNLAWGTEPCPEPQMTQELAWELEGTVDFKIQGNTLTITNKDMVLVFEVVAGQ